jgi:hypothetical protein
MVRVPLLVATDDPHSSTEMHLLRAKDVPVRGMRLQYVLAAEISHPDENNSSRDGHGVSYAVCRQRSRHLCLTGFRPSKNAFQNQFQIP